MAEITDFIQNIQNRRQKRRQGFEKALGLPAVMDNVASQAAVDAAAGTDIMDAMPRVRGRGTAPMVVDDGGGDDSPIISAADTGGRTPVITAQMARPVGRSTTRLACPGGVCSPSQAPAAARPANIATSAASTPAAPGMQSILASIPFEEYDADPGPGEAKLTRPTVPGLLAAAGMASDYGRSEYDRGRAIPAVNAMNTALMLTTQAFNGITDRNTLAQLASNIAAAESISKRSSPAGQMEQITEVLYNSSMPISMRVQSVMLTVRSGSAAQGGAVDPRALAQLETDFAAQALSHDVSTLAMANELATLGGRSNKDAAIASASRNRVNSDLNRHYASVPTNRLLPQLQDQIRPKLQQSLYQLYSQAGYEDSDQRAARQADSYIQDSFNAIVASRAGQREPETQQSNRSADAQGGQAFLKLFGVGQPATPRLPAGGGYYGPMEQ